MFLHQIAHEANSRFIGMRRDLIAGGGNQSGTARFQGEPFKNGVFEFINVNFRKPQVGRNAAGKNEILSGLVTTGFRCQVAGRLGRDGVGTVGIRIANHAERPLEAGRRYGRR